MYDFDVIWFTQTTLYTWQSFLVDSFTETRGYYVAAAKCFYMLKIIGCSFSFGNLQLLAKALSSTSLSVRFTAS